MLKINGMNRDDLLQINEIVGEVNHAAYDLAEMVSQVTMRLMEKSGEVTPELRVCSEISKKYSELYLLTKEYMKVNPLISTPIQ